MKFNNCNIAYGVEFFRFLECVQLELNVTPWRDLMKRLQWLIPFMLVTTLLACAQDRSPDATSAAVATPTASSITNPGPAVTAQNTSGANELAGTSWKLVKLQTGDETTHVPDDPTKYTITFGSNGRVTTRVDCNRASSTWRSTGGKQLQFGSWDRTSAKCGPGSLHDKIVTEGANVRSYSIKDGHLFLSGMAAGGFYELEPLTTEKR